MTHTGGKVAIEATEAFAADALAALNDPKRRSAADAAASPPPRRSATRVPTSSSSSARDDDDSAPPEISAAADGAARTDASDDAGPGGDPTASRPVTEVTVPFLREGDAGGADGTDGTFDLGAPSRRRVWV